MKVIGSYDGFLKNDEIYHNNTIVIEGKRYHSRVLLIITSTDCKLYFSSLINEFYY